MAKTPEVLVVDQNPDVRFEVKRLLSQSPFGLAGEAGFGTEAVSLAVETQPDVIICGMDEPSTRSLQTVEALINNLPETPVVIYSSSRTVEAAREAMRTGARDLIYAPAGAAELEEAVVRALEAEERRRMRMSGQAASLGQCTTITVFGPKGGVGKTTIAANLAVALAQQTEQSVTLLDADTGFGDVAATLDLTPELTLADLAPRVDTLPREEMSRFLCRHSSGVSVLAGPADTFAWRNISADQFRRTLELLSKTQDVIIIDTGGDLGEIGLAALEAATLVLWVTAPEFASVKDTLQGIEALQSISFPVDRIRLAVNRISPENGVRAQTIEDVLQREVFWHVPYDRKLRQESELGASHVMNGRASPAAESLVELARAIGGARRVERTQKAGLAAFFGRGR